MNCGLCGQLMVAISGGARYCQRCDRGPNPQPGRIVLIPRGVIDPLAPTVAELNQAIELTCDWATDFKPTEEEA